MLIDKELSKKQLAGIAGISQCTVNKMIYEDSVNIERLVKICTALKVDIVEIVSLEDGDKKDAN